MSIFSRLAAFITGIFHSIDKEYQQLEPEVKGYFDQGIIIVNEIKAGVNSPAATVIANIAGQGVNLDKLKAILPTVAKDLGLADTIVSAKTPEDFIQAIQNFLKPLTGNGWVSNCLQLAMLIITALSGGKLSWSVVASLTEFVYQHYFVAKAA
jgi:hypothetical protein